MPGLQVKDKTCSISRRFTNKTLINDFTYIFAFPTSNKEHKFICQVTGRMRSIYRVDYI